MARALRLALLAVFGLAALTATGLHYTASGAPPPAAALPSPAPPARVAHAGRALLTALEARPLQVPFDLIGPTFRCPPAPAQAGPVRLLTPARTPAELGLLRFQVADSYAGYLLVRGVRLDGAVRMGFARATSAPGAPAPQLLLQVPVHRGLAAYSVLATNAAGCWAVAVDGYRVSEIFLVNMR